MFFLPTYPIFQNHVIGTTHIFCFGLIKNPKPHAHLQIMAKNSAKFKIKLIKDVAGTRSVSKDHNSIKNGQT